MRKPEETARQIQGIKNQKEGLPERSFFNDPNWKMIDAQLDILEGVKTMDDLDRESVDADDENEEAAILQAAEEAQDWLYGVEGDGMDDVFSEEFAPETYKK